MGASKRPTGDELLRRMTAFADEWRAVAACTDRADRPRAEAALGSLYAAAGRPVPTFVWVPSPAAGILAYTFASRARGTIRGEHVRGDVGTGANRDFNALAEPFGMEPAWTHRLARGIRGRVPPDRLPVHARFDAIDPVVDVAEALGLGGTMRLARFVRDAGGRGARGGHLLGQSTHGASIDVAADVLGEAWPRLIELFGRDLAGSVFVEATRRLVAELLTPSTSRFALQAMQPGQWDAATPVLAAARDVFGGFLWRHAAGRDAHEAQIETRLELARSAGPWWALEGLAIVSERPLVVRTDDRGRPHCAHGPAIAWPDGLEGHAWHGVTVEPWVVTDPARIIVAMIDAEQNVEVRRVLVERFGEERLVREGGAKLVHEDETGRLWNRQIDRWSSRHETLAMVEVRNSTAEPDGSRKTYFLRVPPSMTTAREAVAWTFGLGTVEYRPAIET